MAAGQNNTQKIETLVSQAANLSARLDVFDVLLKGITELLAKCRDAGEGHSTKITVIEQHLHIVDLKTIAAVVASIREELVAVKKDIESIQSWKSEQKREREEVNRRWWSFGPNITAALIGGAITLVGILLNVTITYYLNRPK